MPKIIPNAKEQLMACGEKYMCMPDADAKSLNLRKITSESGMALGTFYSYFEDKDDFIRQILETEWGKVIDSLDQIEEEQSTIHDRLKAFYENVSAYDKKYHRAILRIAGHNNEGLLFQQGQVQRLSKRLENYLQHEIARGDLHLEAMLPNAAYLLVELFVAVSRKDGIDFEELWKCMTFESLERNKPFGQR